MRGTAPERFWAKVDKGDGSTCWLWTAARDKRGYGYFTPSPGHQVMAHRFAFELANGAIPEPLEIDHLCRTPGCVRPDHLEAVTHRENVRRGEGGRPRQERCLNGHLFDYRDANGRGRCRSCTREAMRRHRARKAVA